jgi:hypothetical protein
MTVDTDGIPKDAKISECSDLVFAENSLAAVQQYRFKPAVDQDGKPIPVKITIMVAILSSPNAQLPPPAIKYEFRTPPGVVSSTPDANGIYPLTNSIDAPVMKKLDDVKIGNAAMMLPKGTSCEIILTIDKNGKPSDAKVADCAAHSIKELAIESLLKSRSSPGA